MSAWGGVEALRLVDIDRLEDGLVTAGELQDENGGRLKEEDGRLEDCDSGMLWYDAGRRGWPVT